MTDWPVYVINMAAHTGRMSSCKLTLDRLGIAFQRFDAVNGRDMSEPEIARVYDALANRRRARYPLVAGEIGCYLSHLELWRELAASDHKGAIILEDDFIARPELPLVLASLSSDRSGWDMVKLYSRRPNQRMLSTQALCVGFQLARPYQIPNTTLGYAIRRDAALRLLDNVGRFARPIDEDLKRFWEHGLDIRLVLPPPLGLAPAANSGDAIQAARRRGGGISQGWRNLRYRLDYLARLHFHRNMGR